MLKSVGNAIAPQDVVKESGAEIFRLAMPHAQVAVVTEIDADFEGDVHAPPLGAGWRETAREAHVSQAGVPFSFVTYERAPSGA